METEGQPESKNGRFSTPVPVHSSCMIEMLCNWNLKFLPMELRVVMKQSYLPFLNLVIFIWFRCFVVRLEFAT